MIRLLEMYPEHLNLNGDRGNLLILQRRLEWASIPVQYFTHRAGQPLPTTRPDFVLLGHGSPAAWRQIYADLAKCAERLEDWLEAGTQLLAISSGFAALHGLFGMLPVSVNRTERTSKFVSEDFEGKELVGYLNSDLDLPNLRINSNLIGANLHGPLLAKNVWLADAIITRFGAEPGEITEDKFLRVQNYAEFATSLARELASE